jgi:hypothetical protein
MKTLLLALLLASPAMADGLPFAKGDHVIEAMIRDDLTGAVTPNPLPENEWACFRVAGITPLSFDLTLEAGFLDMSSPLGAKGFPTWGTVGTNAGLSSSEPIWQGCAPQDPTGYITVSTLCDMTRVYRLVPSCKGRPLPP